MKQLVEATRQALKQKFGAVANLHVAAPGRVNLIGEHVDYNDGFVLPMAVERYLVFAIAPNSTSTARFYSVDVNQTVAIDLASSIKPGESDWACYLRGMLAAYQELDYAVPGFDAVIASSLPVGAGLSSSAALCCGTGLVLETLCNRPLPPAQRAQLCQTTEHRFAGVPCGIMDPFASACGVQDALLLLDCRSLEFKSIRMGRDDATVLIINSNVKHELTGSEYGERRAQCDRAARELGIDSWRNINYAELCNAKPSLDPIIYRRAHHVVTEIERTCQTAEAIETGDWQRAGKLMYASHASLRDDFEVSCPELDVLVTLAAERGLSGGVYGARMTGGGFGGSTVWLIDSQRTNEIVDGVTRSYHMKTGIQADAFSTRPAAGAHVL